MAARLPVRPQCRLRMRRWAKLELASPLVPASLCLPVLALVPGGFGFNGQPKRKRERHERQALPEAEGGGGGTKKIHTEHRASLMPAIVRDTALCVGRRIPWRNLIIVVDININRNRARLAGVCVVKEKRDSTLNNAPLFL